ncbi:hypothetical protein B0H16DRAFT_1748637 [Mycena metata]|uniref:Uncharacterized protein n=1 Tax=Mycena metata TaxID=1033252 RepID=A0AAD7GPJ2_9AGAR|nr:hypothetical protein B0H16DRAFT_1748637 [Mycena metata]
MVPPPNQIYDALLIGGVLLNQSEVALGHLPCNASTLRDEPLLRCYAAEWDRSTTGANNLNQLFIYLNRYWVKRERDEGKRVVYQVYTNEERKRSATVADTPLARRARTGAPSSVGLPPVTSTSSLSFFLRDVRALTQPVVVAVASSSPRLFGRKCGVIQTVCGGSSGLLGTVSTVPKQPGTQSPDNLSMTLVKIIDLYVSLGLDAGDPNKECFDVYKEKFESPFSAVPPAGGGSLGGMKKTLLDFDADADLQRMYAVLAHIPEELEPLRRKFDAHVESAGMAAVEGVAAAAPAKKGTADADAEETAPKGGPGRRAGPESKNVATVAQSFKRDRLYSGAG